MGRVNALLPVHPGEIIREDVLPEVGLSAAGMAKALGVSRQMVHEILGGRKALSPVMCLKVSRLFGSTPEFWMGRAGSQKAAMRVMPILAVGGKGPKLSLPRGRGSVESARYRAGAERKRLLARAGRIAAGGFHDVVGSFRHG